MGYEEKLRGLANELEEANRASRLMAPDDYERTVATGGTLERKYLARGGDEVAYFETEAGGALKKFEIYYPVRLRESDARFPVVLVGNGYAARASRYPAVFRHYASRGFITIGNEQEAALLGDGFDACYEYLATANDDPNSLFYGKVDLDSVGLLGHSLGGVGAINAATRGQFRAAYKTAVVVSPVAEDFARYIGWDYDPTALEIPLLLASGGIRERISPKRLESLYSRVASEKVMAIRIDSTHAEALYSCDGYATAWLLWKLCGDEEAARAFVGDAPEMMTNTLYSRFQRSAPRL